MKPILCIALMLLPVWTIAQNEKTDSTFALVEKMPEFPGGQEALIAYLSKELRYPEEARKSGAAGKVVTQFVVSENGSISDIQIIRSVGCGCDEEAIRVISKMPQWVPGMQDGVPIKVYFKMPITFKMSTDESKNTGIMQASFPGGDKALEQFLKKNVLYPDAAKKNKISGDVQVKFTIQADGSTNNIQIISSLGSGCDEEAVRAIQSMPAWLPAKKNCVAMESAETLSIHFPPK